MSHIQIPRGEEDDIEFKLRNNADALVDDEDWNDGSTKEEWPVVTVKDDDGNDVTSKFDKDISGDTIDAATHKHPDKSTGIWRDEKGVYNLRTKPDTDLSLEAYTLNIAFDIGGSRIDDEHTIILVSPGDVDFGSNILTTIDVEEITAGIETSLSSDNITDLISEAALFTKGELEMCGLDPDSWDEVPAAIQTAIIYATRALILRRDLGAGVSISSIREGNKRISYNSGSSVEESSEMFWNLWDRGVTKYCQSAGTGGPRVKTDKKKTWDQVYGDSQHTFGTKRQSSDG